MSVKGDSVIEEINIICVGDLRYKFNYNDISKYNLDFTYEIFRIDFKDSSFIEFQKRNVICVEINKK